jgi:serine/threonine protein kinase
MEPYEYIKKDQFIKSLLDGLTFNDSKIKSIRYLARGGAGKIWILTFSNDMNIIFKLVHTYNGLHEVENLIDLCNLPHICHYYGFNTIIDGKYQFKSCDNSLQFRGTLPKLPHHILKYTTSRNLFLDQSVPNSYFNIIMEHLYFVNELDLFNYKKVDTTMVLIFIINILRGIDEITQKHIIHGDIHTLRNIGFFKTTIDNKKMLLPKLIDFGMLRHTNNLINIDTDTWLTQCRQNRYRSSCAPEINGQLDESYNYSETALKNNIWNKDKSYGSNTSDLYMFFNGIILINFLQINAKKYAHSNRKIRNNIIRCKYYIINDSMYNSIKHTILVRLNEHVNLNKNLFISNEHASQFVNNFTNLILSIINPNYKLRPNVKSCIHEIEKYVSKYFVESEASFFKKSENVY